MSDEEVAYALRWNNNIASSSADLFLNEASCWTSSFSSNDLWSDILWVQSVAFTNIALQLSTRWSSTSLRERGNNKLVFSWSSAHAQIIIGQVRVGRCSNPNDIKLLTLIVCPDKTVVNDDVSLPHCEFRLVQVLRDFLFCYYTRLDILVSSLQCTSRWFCPLVATL
jgi:hypothetical protein